MTLSVDRESHPPELHKLRNAHPAATNIINQARMRAGGRRLQRGASEINLSRVCVGVNFDRLSDVQLGWQVPDALVLDCCCRGRCGFVQ